MLVNSAAMSHADASLISNAAVFHFGNWRLSNSRWTTGAVLRIVNGGGKHDWSHELQSWPPVRLGELSDS